jgi:hypothetical protein
VFKIRIKVKIERKNGKNRNFFHRVPQAVTRLFLGRNDHWSRQSLHKRTIQNKLDIFDAVGELSGSLVNYFLL